MCAEVSDTTIYQREVRALAAAADEYADTAPVLVTLTPELIREIPDRVAVLGADEWLLGVGVGAE